MQWTHLTYHQFLDSIPAAALVIGRDEKIALANPQAGALLGYLPGELNALPFQALLPAMGQKELEAFWLSLESQPEGITRKIFARRKDGTEFPVDIRLMPVEIDKAVHAVVVVQDLRAPEETSSKNRVLALMNACYHRITRAEDEIRLLQEICLTCVETGGYCRAWVEYTGPDEVKTPGPVAQAGSEPGFAASIKLPLTGTGGVLGVLNLYSEGADAFGPEEARLLEELAGDLAYGIEALRARTLRARAEKALAESEERYHLISAVASDYMFSTRLDAGGRLILDWTAGAFETITGYTQAEYIAQGGWRARLHPDDLALDDRDLEKLRANQAVITEIRTLHKNGQTVWVRVYAQPVWDAQRGELVGMYGAVQDITEHKHTEEILEASEKRLSLIFETVSDVIFLLAIEPQECFRFVAINPAFLAVTGLPREQVIGKRMEEVLPKAVRAFVIGQYRQAIATNKTVRWEEMSEYPTGTLYGEVAVTPYRNATGVCTHLVGSVHDITEIRRVEKEMRTLNQDLEQRVARRTAQLQTANKDLESFSYSVSHDLRAPLRAISGFAAIIARRHRASLNEEGRHYVDNIVLASERMGHLIDDLLTYSRLGRASLRRERLAMNTMLAPIVSDLEGRLRQIGGSLSVDEHLPTVVGDKTLIHQIFSNLLENALKYRKADVPLKITVSARVEDKMATLWVADNGIGILPEFHERIFNIFQRLHSDEEVPGTGIGLATVKKSIELLGGAVWVESTFGEGSTFFVKIPQE